MSKRHALHILATMEDAAGSLRRITHFKNEIEYERRFKNFLGEDETICRERY